MGVAEGCAVLGLLRHCGRLRRVAARFEERVTGIGERNPRACRQAWKSTARRRSGPGYVPEEVCLASVVKSSLFGWNERRSKHLARAFFFLGGKKKKKKKKKKS